MNGSEAVLPKLNIPLGHPEVIQVLERLLADARSGRLAGVGVVAIEGSGNLSAIIAGSAALPVVYTGAGMLQASAMQRMTTKPSGLVVPVR
jgi:hypothetical protein